MLDFQLFKKGKVTNDPYTWAHIVPVMEEPNAKKLMETFPQKKLKDSVSNKQHYKLRDCTCIDNGELMPLASEIDPVWHELFEDLLKQEYRNIVSKLMQTSLDNCFLKVRLCEYGAGCWMLPHTDRIDRVVTQIFYLTPWDTKWGGTLKILYSDNINDVAQEIIPTFNTSVMFARSDTSYHAVAPVNINTCKPRLTILSQFIRK